MDKTKISEHGVKKIAATLESFGRDDLMNLRDAIGNLFAMGLSEKSITNLSPVQQEAMIRFIDSARLKTKK